MKNNPAASRNSAPRLRILIVDDIPQVLADLGFLLELDPRYQVVGSAKDGQEAVRLAEALQPQVILLDLEMPVMDGFTAAGLIKSKTPHSTLAALSIHSTPADRERAAAAGFDLFIEKGTPLDGVLNTFLSKGE